MNHHPEDQQFDALSEYLDGDRAPGEEPSVDLSKVPTDEIARHLLVVGALQQLLHHDHAAVRAQVRQGMVAVHQADRLVRRGVLRRRLVGGLAAAAAIAVTALMLWNRPADLQPIIDRMQAYLRADQDRQYTLQGTSRQRRFRFLEMQTELSVRGNERFVLSFSTEVFGTDLSIKQGFDGEDYWVVLPDLGTMLGGRDLPADFRAPVLVSSTSLASCFRANSARFLDEFARGLDRLEIGAGIFSQLADLRRHYTVRAAEADAKVFQPRAGEMVLHAERRSQTDPAYPETIDFLLDTRSGTVEQLIVEYMELPGQLGRRNPFQKIHYVLKGEFPRLDSDYQHTGHHDGTRLVVRQD